uniref:cAMP-dependent protein kinase inhibitor beta n=1 Tax=Callithrix jacchus TaxID=9483 RepID=A0A8I3W9H6_CALJA
MDVHFNTLQSQESKSNSGSGSNSRDQKDLAMRTDSSKMTDVEPGVTNFASSARAGRRNALPDIQSLVATGGTSDLPLKLEALSVKEGNTQYPLKINSIVTSYPILFSGTVFLLSS